MYTVKGICIKAVDYKEKDRILTLATVEKGIITAVARGVRSPTAKLKTAAMPLCFGEFSLNEKGNTLVGADIEEYFFECWQNTEKCASAFYVLELLEKNNIAEQTLTEDLIFTLNVMKEINYGCVKPKLIVLKTAIRYFEKQGIDYSEIEIIPVKIIRNFRLVEGYALDELEACEITEEEVDEALRCANMIFIDSLGIKSNIFKNLVSFS